jgi:hypothetical protein
LLWVKNSQKFSVSAWKLAATEDIDGNTVYLGFSNELTLDTFVAEKPHINSFFNENYDRTPQFEVMVTELAKEQMRPYTNMDKFNFLAKKYPKLNEMRLKIGLEAN